MRPRKNPPFHRDHNRYGGVCNGIMFAPQAVSVYAFATAYARASIRTAFTEPRAYYVTRLSRVSLASRTFKRTYAAKAIHYGHIDIRVTASRCRSRK